MRRGFVVLVLLAMMVGLQTLKAETSGQGDPLTLAAIGFVVLAAFAVAELGAKASLPKVTGYIVSGVVLGPYAASVLSHDIIGEMAMFKQLALGLIAITAGLELDLKGLRSLAKTLSATIGLKIILGFLLVGGTVIAGEMFLGVLNVEGTSALFAVALVMGALSLGTSPAIALAIISENKAKGRLTDTVLGAAIVKDIVVVIVLALAVASAKGLLGGGGVGVEVLVHVGKELGLSAGLGALVGVLLIAYLRWIKAEMLLFVAAVVLVVGQISNALHLELLLVFIVAGLVVRNFSDHEHDLLHPLETVSLPVFIVFFTTAGAEVDLRATVTVLPLAIAVCSARAVAFVISGRLGGRVGGEPEPVQRLAWLGYLPQAGVTLGLLALASQQIPELAEPILALGMAVVALNLLVGPITMRLALRKAGEIPGDEVAADGSAQPRPGEEETGAPWERLRAPELRAIVKAYAEAEAAAMTDYVRRRLAPWVVARSERLADPLPDDGDHRQALTAINNVLEHLPPDDAPARVEGVLRLFGSRVAALESIRAQVTVPLEPEFLRPLPEDSLGHASRKRVARVLDALRFRFSKRTRTVPARAATRTVVEPRLARALEETVRNWYRAEARMFEELRRCALGTVPSSETAAAIREIGESFVSDADADLQLAVTRSARALARKLAVVGSPIDSAARVRYSKVEPELVAWRQRLTSDAEAWATRRDAGARLVGVVNEVALIERRIRDLL
ncbi:MAG: cation:proton antiporter, partial [Nannocystaceae bacterium]|nr:cation:proton antiporter [Nannocystaceae bacterium]